MVKSKTSTIRPSYNVALWLWFGLVKDDLKQTFKERCINVMKVKSGNVTARDFHNVSVTLLLNNKLTFAFGNLIIIFITRALGGARVEVLA